MSQFERISYIDRAIHERGAVTTREVATHFENSERQIKRDIEYMRDRIGMSLVYDYTKRGYRYDKESSLLRYSNEKALIFFSLLRSILENKDMLPLVDKEALKVVKDAMSSEYRDISDKITYTTSIADPPNYKTFSECCIALKDNMAVTIAYLNAQHIPSIRTVEPLHLISYSNKWYMVAFDLTKQDLRSFHLGRIQSIMPTSLPIASRNLEEKVASYLSSGFGIFNGEEAFRVGIEIYSPASHTIKNQVWHKDQMLSETYSNGELVVTIEVPTTHFNEILSKVLSFGSLAKPLYPEEFVSLWKKEVKKLGEIAEG
jgi:predicted DNA-binding transcriptional regulator YafY